MVVTWKAAIHTGTLAPIGHVLLNAKVFSYSCLILTRDC